MSIQLELPKLTELKPRITVIGVGGAGGNAINNMIASGLKGVEFVAANTDAQALAMSSAEHRIQLGTNLTEGLGAGSKREIGEAAAEEAYDEIRSCVTGSHMVFVAGGMGGGTGTGAAPVIARCAKEQGILTVGVVTKPFQFEGARRMRMAEAGVAELRKYVDTLIVIPNQNLFRLANEKTTFAEAFVLADQVLYSGVACIVDLIIKEGLINLDFADVRTIMGNMGSAMMGTGEATGERRAVHAAEEAIANPLLDDVSLKGAKGLLLSIIGGKNLTLYEVDEAASRVRQEVDPDANIIVGATFDDTMGDRVRVSIVASGMGEFEGQPAAQARVRGPQSSPPKPGLVAPAQSGPLLVENGPHDLQRRVADQLSPGSRPHAASAVTARDADDAPLELSAAQEVNRAGRNVWHAPGDVIIEERPPQLSSPGQQPPPPSQPAAAPPAFMPQQPADVRRPPRRIPEVEEFPVVGQREYRARAPAPSSGAGPGQSPPPRIAEPPPASQKAPEAPTPAAKPRRSFFDRLTGGAIARRTDDSSTTVPAPAPPRPNGTSNKSDRTSEPRPSGAGLSSPGHTDDARSPRSGSAASGPSAVAAKKQDDVELPMFFNRERR